jgi:protein gp37
MFPERLSEPLKLKPSMIFIAPSGDIMGKWIPFQFIYDMFKTMNKCPQHIFQLLTKNPERYQEIIESLFTPNIWIGTSVTRMDDIGRIKILKDIPGPAVKFISFEPLMEYVTCDLTGIDWVIIGAKTVRNAYTAENLFISKEFARHLIKQVPARIPIFIKPNLKWNCDIKKMPSEFYEWKKKYHETDKQQNLL